MAKEFSGLGSQLFIGHKDTGKVFRIDLPSHERTLFRKSYREEELDRIMATPPSEVIVPQGDGSLVLFGKPKPFTFPASIKPHEEPIEFDNTDHWFHGVPPSGGFSFSGTCELPDSAETEALRDMMLRDMPEMQFDVQILPSLYEKCYGGAPRKILKAMNHGGYYRRNTKWKRKAIALYNRYPEQSPFTICNANMKIEENGEVLILGRGISKTKLIRQRRSKQHEKD